MHALRVHQRPSAHLVFPFAYPASRVKSPTSLLFAYTVEDPYPTSVATDPPVPWSPYTLLAFIWMLPTWLWAYPDSIQNHQ